LLVHEVELINAVIDNKEIVEIGGRRGERVEEARKKKMKPQH